MDVLYLKIIFLIVMMIIAILFGLLPSKIYDYVKQKQRNGDGKRASTLLSLLSCLAGGVFLGVCLLDLLPFAHETFEKVRTDTKFTSEYPFVELMVGGGFFFVYFVEEISMKLCHSNDAEEETESSYCDDCVECQNAREIDIVCGKADTQPVFGEGAAERTNEEDVIFGRAGAEFIDNKPAFTAVSQMETKTRDETVASRRLRATTILSNRIRTSSVIFKAKENIMENASSAQGTGDELVKSITFIAAFTFHSTLEGFAFGVQGTTISVATLFFGIIVHKAIVAFSIGMRLVRCHPEKRCFVICLIIFVALTAPLGGAIGIAVQNSKMDEVPKNIVSTVLTCIALGTFLYITFFEILFTEQTSRAPKLLQWFCTLLGFGVIALLMMVGD